MDKKLEKIILEKGKNYIPKLAPKNIKRGKVGDCFDTSIIAALKHNLKYVEGMARNPHTGEWILHAWVSDGVHAFDLTWYAENAYGEMFAVQTEYVGVEMDTMLVCDFMKATGYKSVFNNAWRDQERANKILC